MEYNEGPRVKWLEDQLQKTNAQIEKLSAELQETKKQLKMEQVKSVVNLGRLKMASRDADDVGHEYSGSGWGASTAEEVQHSLYGPVEDIPEEPEHLEDEDDDMADSIVDEEEDLVDDAEIYMTPRDADVVHSGLSDEYSGSEEKVKRSLYGDDAGPVEDIPEEDQQLEAEEPQDLNDKDDGMAHSTLDEEGLFDYAERYMTDEDNCIIQIDIPERMQISEVSTGTPPTDDDSMVKEAKWIKEQFKSGQVPGLVKIVLGDDMEEHIINFLKFSHVERLDLPFIAMYRKEDISCLLKDPETGEDVSHDKPALKRHKVLWAVHDLDRKWLLLQKRKKALQGNYHMRFEEISCKINDETRLRFDRQVYESIISALRLADSERELDVVDSKFNLHFPPGKVHVDDIYRRCKEAGLWKFASKFGYSSEQLVDEMEDPKETPEDVALNFTCESFDSVEAVLMFARYMASVDLSHEPRVKNHFRSKYFDNAVVSTRPISDGNVVIDAFHQLCDKPLNEFEDAQWLLIQKAEEEELLQVTIKLPEENLLELISESEKLYLSVSVSELAQLWNVQRKMILEDAIINHILPALEKEARFLLTNRAKNWLLLDYGERLWDKVSVAPYQTKKRESSSDDEAAPRVMACCWGSGKPPTTFVMLDSCGEIVDVLEAGSMSLGIQNDTDKLNLVKFMMKNQPQVVVVGAVNLSCIWLKDDIYEIVIDLFRDKILGHELDWVSVVSGDEFLPRLYENSSISDDQIPMEEGYVYVKRAAALGRYLQNPLAMVANLCAPSKKVLSWKLSPLESFLNADEKYAMVEQIMVDVTNQVGIDLNLAAKHGWLFAPMQFISGLGPRKAAALERSLSGAGEIVSRKDLLTHGLGTKVYDNAAGFLRIMRCGLDDTRIHPESYILAQEMVKYIYKKFVSDDNLGHDVGIKMAIKNLRDDPSAWKAFDVDAYGKDTDCLSKAKTLRVIKLELIQGFQDWRKPYEEPNPDEQFFMIYGANVTVDVGQTVKATVRSVKTYVAICELESGLTGILLREDCSDDWRDVDLTGKLHEGDTLTCKIKRFQKTWYVVYLTCRENDMRNIGHQNGENLDPYYHEDSSSLSSEQDKARRGKEVAEYNS